MAKHIILNTDGSFSRLASTDEAKDFWEAQGYTSSSISDDQFNGVRWSTKSYEKDGTWVDNSEAPVITFTRLELEEELAKFVSIAEHSVANHDNAPSHWATDLNTLKSTNYDSLDDGGAMASVTGYNWVDASEKNSIPIPLVLEV